MNFVVSELQHISELNPDVVNKIFTDKSFLPVTPQEQCAIIDLLHYGLHRPLKPLNFFQRFSWPHEVESVDNRFPKPAYFVITVLLCFQNLGVHDMSSFS
jgi:hypothetical protein